MFKKFVQKNLKFIIILIGILFLSFLFFHNSYYFEFDKIEHYKITKEIDFPDSDNDSVQIENEKILSEILYKRTPTKLNGTEFLNNLNKIEFIKKNIPSSDFDKIKEIFKEQYCSVQTESACISVFRDILVFYEKNKVIGIAKICFSCNDRHIIGTTSDTYDFGQCGNYEKLFRILK